MKWNLSNHLLSFSLPTWTAPVSSSHIWALAFLFCSLSESNRICGWWLPSHPIDWLVSSYYKRSSVYWPKLQAVIQGLSSAPIEGRCATSSKNEKENGRADSITADTRTHRPRAAMPLTASTGLAVLMHHQIGLTSLLPMVFPRASSRDDYGSFSSGKEKGSNSSKRVRERIGLRNVSRPPSYSHVTWFAGHNNPVRWGGELNWVEIDEGFTPANQRLSSFLETRLTDLSPPFWLFLVAQPKKSFQSLFAFKVALKKKIKKYTQFLLSIYLGNDFVLSIPILLIG